MPPHAAFSAPGAWREVAERVFVAVAEPATVNLGLVVGDDGCLLVDSGSSPAQGSQLRASVKTVTDVPLVAVVVTHWHYDHAFGLAGFDGVETIAHESVRERLTSPAAASLAAELGFEATALALPSREVVVAAGVELGGRRVEIAQLGRGHTEGDLVVVVSDADLLFAGDLLESAGAPEFGDDCFPHEWAATLDGVVGLMTEVSRAVPGHGEPVNREFVFEARGRVAAVSGEIRRLAEAGVPVEQALAAGSWAYPEANVAEGIPRGYQQLAPGPVVTAVRRLPLA